MRLHNPPLILLTAVALFSAARAQSTASSADVQSGTKHYRAAFSGPFSNVRPGITGAPYSAEQTFETLLVLPDGTRRARVWTEWLYRDSQGRTRCERPMMSPPGADMRIRLVQIVDPIGGYQYVIDTVNKVVHRIKVPPDTALVTDGAVDSTSAPVPSATLSVRALSRLSFHNDTLNLSIPSKESPEISTEGLGLGRIEGILVQGVKTTMRYPAGSVRDGRPVTITTEAWVSGDLKVVVMSKRDDPRDGVSVTRMSNYRSSEPDPALFQPPPDYTIVDENGSFSIDIALPVQGALLVP